MMSSFTTTPASTWNNYDIYTNLAVPKGSVVEIVLCNLEAGTEQTMGVRKDGSTLDRYFSIHEAESGGESTVTMVVQVDSSTGLIEVYTTSTTNYFRVLGYFTNSAYTEEWSSTTASGGLSWIDWDLGTDNSLVHTIVAQSLQQDVLFGHGLRTNGDTAIDFTVNAHEPEAGGGSQVMWYVKSDSSDIIEYYVNV